MVAALSKTPADEPATRRARFASAVRAAVSFARARDNRFFVLTLAAFATLGLVGLGWGMPASDGWDNDGVAPRDFLPGLVETYTPGHYYTYPPVQLLILGIATLPITLVALARAQSLSPPDLVHEFIKVPYMTGIAMVSRAVTLAMAIGIVWTVAKIAEELGGKRARDATAVCVAVNASLLYYAHTTNLDVPYIFFGVLVLLELVRALARREPRRYRRAAILAVLAVGTKDQAYGLFVGAIPVVALSYFVVDAWARANARRLLREAGVAAAIGIGLFLVTDAVVINPTGFRARLAFLTGPASQDFVHYTNDWAGRWLVVRDIFENFPRYYPYPFAVLGVVGLAIAVGVARRSGRGGGAILAALLPLLFAVSFTAFFNCVARRTDHRFGLPQHVILAVYMGVGVGRLWDIGIPKLRAVVRVLVLATFLRAAIECAAICATLVLDPRYDAERWLREHVRPGDVIEVHAHNVYLPRFPETAKVVRVGQGPVSKRNPLPNVTEVCDTYANVDRRRPRFIVVPQGWVWRYLLDPEMHMEKGRVLPPTQIAGGSEADGGTFFKALVAGRAGYREAYKATWQYGFIPRIDIHASTGQGVWIYERID